MDETHVLKKRCSLYALGGASGIGRAAAGLLVERGYYVYLADLDSEGAKEQAAKLNVSRGSNSGVWAGQVDVSDWESQRRAFEDALNRLGAVDIVLPIAGIGERKWLPRPSRADGFTKPNLAVQEVDETGLMYTTALAVQHFRWMKQDDPTFYGRSEYRY